ncbi:MAG: DUF434 domain-containing protein [bacterium]|nr:DUF434 domain-containing protein [bacterium]
MPKNVRRGYVESDYQQFAGRTLISLQQAAEEVQYLLNHGYPIKQVTTFVGNHYLFSERQRLALSRSISTDQAIDIRNKKLVKEETLVGKTVHVDGFNTIITLEVALSGSLVLECRDGCIRDLAGLRGTYRMIEQTETAVHLVFHQLEQWGVTKAVVYLDQPVSNSGRLGQLIKLVATEYKLEAEVEIRCDVDPVLETMENVITSDAIILNKCISWCNLTQALLQKISTEVWKVRL